VTHATSGVRSSNFSFGSANDGSFFRPDRGFRQDDHTVTIITAIDFGNVAKAPQMSPSLNQSLPSAVSFTEYSAMKRADRDELAKLPPDEAQALVDSVLRPRLWQVADPAQLTWPGDLADSDDYEV
jgi:protein-tyrosine-phosphatase